MSDAATDAPLARLYERARAGDGAQAFWEIVGLAPAGPIQPLPPPITAPMIRYASPRKIDRTALLRGARPVAKFEDLSAGVADALERDLRGHGLRTLRVGPYQKRFDVALAGAYGQGDLFCVIASRGAEAEAVRDAEQDRSAEGTRRAGLALGYPPCCVAHFVAVEGSERARREGVNEAAIRSPKGQGGMAPWEMNLLSSLSPLGFIPCDVRCPAALAMARRILTAVRDDEPADHALISAVLRRPILFFRYPIFFVLDGEAIDDGVHYRAAILADDDTGAHGPLHALAHGAIGQWLARGDRLALRGDALEIHAGATPIARFSLADPSVPRLLRFEGA